MRCSSPLPCSSSSEIILWLWTYPRRHLREARLDPCPSCRPSILDDSQTLASRPAQNSGRAIHTQPKPSINHQHLQHLGWTSGWRSSRTLHQRDPAPAWGAEPLELRPVWSDSNITSDDDFASGCFGGGVANLIHECFSVSTRLRTPLDTVVGVVVSDCFCISTSGCHLKSLNEGFNESTVLRASTHSTNLLDKVCP